MARELVMPKLGLTMTQGTVTKWYFNEGDRVKAVSYTHLIYENVTGEKYGCHQKCKGNGNKENYNRQDTSGCRPDKGNQRNMQGI